MLKERVKLLLMEVTNNSKDRTIPHAFIQITVVSNFVSVKSHQSLKRLRSCSFLIFLTLEITMFLFQIFHVNLINLVLVKRFYLLILPFNNSCFGIH